MKHINFKGVVRNALLASAFLLPLGCGGRKTIYRVEEPLYTERTEFQGGGEYNDRYVPIVKDTSKTVQPSYDRPIYYIPDSGYFTVCFDEGPKELLITPITEVSTIIDWGRDGIGIYDTAGLFFKVTGLPGDTVVVEERMTKVEIVNGRETESKEMREIWKGKGSFKFTPKVDKRLFIVSIHPQAQVKPYYPESGPAGYSAPPSPFVPYSTSGSPFTLTPNDNVAFALWFNIKNPNDWYFRENSLIKTLRRVNGGSLDPADLRAFFVGPYYNSILAMRELGYVPNVSADLNLAFAFRLLPQWLYGNLGLKGETHMRGTEFFSRGTPYAGVAARFPWHLGSENGTNEFGVRSNYNGEKGYTLNLADTTTRVFENRGWSLDLAYLFSMNDHVAVSLGINNVLYSIYGNEWTYNSSLQEIGSKSDIYIRPPRTFVVGLGMGGLYSPIVVGFDTKFFVEKYPPLSFPFYEIDGGLAFSFTPYNEPFVLTIYGGYPRDGIDKWISLSISVGSGNVGFGGSAGCNLDNGNLINRMYSFGFYGRNNNWPY